MPDWFKAYQSPGEPLRFYIRWADGKVIGNNLDMIDAVALIKPWCVEQFGPESMRWYTIAVTFIFRDADDAFAFKMRWG